MEFLTRTSPDRVFAGLIVFCCSAVAFSLGACNLFFGFIGIELGVLPESLRGLLRIFGIMQNDTLLAIRSSPSWA